MGSFFVPTLLTETVHLPCPAERQSTYNNNQNLCKGYQSQTSKLDSFVMNSEDSKISAEVTIQVPGIKATNQHKGSKGFVQSYDSRQHGMRTELILSNGTVLNSLSMKEFSGQVLTLPLSKWIELGGIEEGLDGINHNVNIQGSVGKARHRLVGLILHIRIEATSQDNENWGLPGGRVFSRWYLESEPVWQRIINPDIYLPSGAIQSTSLYGVRFHFTKLPSLVMVPSAEQTLRSLLDLGIVLIGLKMLAYVVALNCYGDDSRRWKKTVYNECEVLSSMHEEQALKMSFIDFKKRMSKLNVGADEVEMLESATEYVQWEKRMSKVDVEMLESATEYVGEKE